jgi:type II secretory pathway component GspD/PulD (secretin)
MLRITVGRTACCLLAALCIGSFAVWGQARDASAARVEAATQTEKPQDKAAESKSKRIVYAVKHGSAKDLAAVLGKHFKSDVEIQTLPDSPSNLLLINAAPAAFDEVLKLLAQLDRQPQVVSVQVLVAEVAGKKGEGGKPEAADKELDEREFTGSSDEVLAKIEALRKKGLIGGYKQLQLAAVENQRAAVLVGDMKPFVTAVTVTARGTTSRAISYRNVGTSVQVTARVGAGKKVELELDVSDARSHVPEDGIVLGKDEAGQPVRATEFITAKLMAKLSVTSGQALAAKGVKTTSKSGQAQTLVIVTARVVEPDAKPGK